MGNNIILCGIFGDIIGKHYEFIKPRPKVKDFELYHHDSTYTDDTVCSIAVMKWLLTDAKEPLDKIMRETCAADIKRSYGRMFRHWIEDKEFNAYNSFGNGSTMRSSPIGWFAKTEEESAIITHNHNEGIKGAQAIALAVFLAKNGKSKEEIKNRIAELFGYNLNRSLDEIRPHYKFDETCQGSVPEAIICFLESDSIEDAVRNAVSLGGDTDTQAIMSGAIAEAFYNDFNDSIIYSKTFGFLPKKYIKIIAEFNKKIDNR